MLPVRIARSARFYVAAFSFALVLAGCETSEPGGGFTNGPPPDLAPEKAGVQTDLKPPDRPDTDTQAGQQAEHPKPEVAGTGGAAPQPKAAPAPGDEKKAPQP